MFKENQISEHYVTAAGLNDVSTQTEDLVIGPNDYFGLLSVIQHFPGTSTTHVQETIVASNAAATIIDQSPINDTVSNFTANHTTWQDIEEIIKEDTTCITREENTPCDFDERLFIKRWESVRVHIRIRVSLDATLYHASAESKQLIFNC